MCRAHGIRSTLRKGRACSGASGVSGVGGVSGVTLQVTGVILVCLRYAVGTGEGVKG
jgi:hypothetical protein